MTEKSKGQELLENAYKLATPSDNAVYYDEFADTYDTDFAEALGWHYPRAIAETYRKLATDADVPVADVGCGTGLVAEALGLAPALIDGLDISAEMLAKANAKGLYRSTMRVDLTDNLGRLAEGYGAVVSAGTFTSGHLGPEPLVGLLRIAKPGGLFVIGINRAFYDAAGFGPAIDDIEARGLITDRAMIEVPMYDREGHDHSGDMAVALCFRKV